jgi:hypothetical protein
MSADEFSEWASRHNPAEVEQRAIELQSQLDGELLDSAGHTFDEYVMASRDGRQLMIEKGVQVWLDEAAEREAEEADRQRQQEDEEAAEARADRHARNEEGLAVQRRFCERHPEFVPGEELGNRLRDAYLEINPGATEWTDLDLERAYCNLLTEGLSK